MAAEEAVLRSLDATVAQYGADSTAAAMCDLRLGTIRMGAPQKHACRAATWHSCSPEAHQHAASGSLPDRCSACWLHDSSFGLFIGMS